MADSESEGSDWGETSLGDLGSLLLSDDSESEELSEDISVKVVPYLNEGVYRLREISYYQPNINEIFHERIRNTVPILVKGFVSQWPAIEKWKSVEYLSNLFGDKTVTAYEAKDNLNFFASELTIHHQWPGNEMVTKILEDRAAGSQGLWSPDGSHQKWYCRAGFRKRFLEDVKLPYRMVLPTEEAENIDNKTFSLPWRQHNCTVWVGTAGDITPLHYDLCHGFLCQVVGTKIVTFFHKDDFRSVYPNPHSHINRTASKLINYRDFRSGDKKLQEEYPLLNDVTPYVCVLNPGDFLYIPPYFWHHVECVNSTVSVVLPFGKSEEDPAHPCEFFDV